MKVVDIADEIYRELSYPTDISIPVIGFWLRTNIGSLNNLIDSAFLLNNSNLEISPEPSIEERSILKKMYLIHYYDIQIRSVLGAAAVDSVIEVSSDGATVRKINRNELSKTYLSVRKDHVGELNFLITNYKTNKINPIQVAGDDTIMGSTTSSNAPRSN
jgi:hypothetical protein